MASTYELIATIGKSDLIRLQAAIGPAQTYIPTLPEKQHPIAKAIGYKAMGLLCFGFGGSTVWIGNGYANQQRNEEILRLVLAGISRENIGRSYGITARYVRILTEVEVAPVWGPRGRHARRKKTAAAFGHVPVRRLAMVQGVKK